VLSSFPPYNGYRGGCWGNYQAFDLMKSIRSSLKPGTESPVIGFRVASVGTTATNGDYNANGLVDAADYVLWRKLNETPAAYTVWRTNFGTSIGGGDITSNAIPEPASVFLAIIGFAAFAFGRCKPTSHNRV
jgi:hypothetical protein